MALALTLKPNERVIINGCALVNANRRQTIYIESIADVVRGSDLLDEKAAATPVTRVYFMIQTALTQVKHRETLVPLIQKDLAQLACVFGGASLSSIFKSANFISSGDFYKAMASLRPVIKHERDLFERIEARKAAEAGAAPSDPHGMAAE